MPRIRTIKPEFWDSPGTARASLRGRLFFIAMWNWADDWGIGTANAKQLVGFAFPNDDEVTAADFPRLATEVADCYDVQWYEVENRPYFAIPSWDQHQKNERRASKRNPGPDQGFSIAAEMRGDSVRSDGKTPIGTGEQGNRGTGEQSSTSEIAVAIPRPEIDHLCNLLADLIEGNGSRRPEPGKKWHDAARLLIDKDGKTPEQIESAIRWSQSDEFWRSNILSMPKLREKYEQLRLAATRQKPTQQQQQSKAARNAAEFRRLYGHQGSVPALDAGVSA
jgi:hypothetical protein